MDILNEIADPTFIVAAIAAIAAVASAWISWRGFHLQSSEATAPPIVNVDCMFVPGDQPHFNVILELQNLGVVRWRATKLEVRNPTASKVIPKIEIDRIDPNGRRPTVDVSMRTNVCLLGAEIAPCGINPQYGAGDRHWERILVFLDDGSHTALSMRLTFSSMEAKPRLRVITIKRTAIPMQTTAT